ncbi:MAG TPA: Ada metal-binding domain-containing protein [Tepidisphaeraceae bacterium]|nr:Ada metal-binding domain-containing protein [Tepidisphaeraceae bacterium]
MAVGSISPGKTDWNAILKRDRRFDGKFVYAALTTGIYCRPSCPARHPLRQNTLVFATPADAEREGFTACLRCHPKSGSPSDAELGVKRAIEWIESHFQQPLTLNTFSQVSGLSPNHFQQVFKRLVGMSPKEFIDAKRLDYLKGRIKRGVSISTASFQAGFGSSRALYERVTRRMGMTPGVFSRGGRRIRVSFGVLGSGTGKVLIAATGVGICAVFAGGHAKTLESRLHAEFPQAAIRRLGRVPRSWAKAINSRAADDDFLSKLAPDLQRRIVEIRIWNALQ